MFAMLRQIWDLRFFCAELARHDLKDRYRRSVLGLAWSLIKPASMTLILTVIFTHVFDATVLDYAPFLFVGIITWQFFTESMVQGCNAFRLGNTYLRLRPVPIAIFPLRVILSAGLHALIGLAAAIIAIACIRGFEQPLALLALVPAFCILAVTAWSLACICGVLHALYADTQQIVEIGLQGLFYATPVLYSTDSLRSAGWLHWVVEFNPFAAMIEMVRRPLLMSEIPDAHVYMVALIFMTASATAACLTLRRAENRIMLWL